MSADQDHANAILALLRAAPGSPALVVLPDAAGDVPDGLRPPYVRVYIHLERPGATAVTAQTDRAAAYITCHSVGANDIAARAVAARVNAALLDVTPTVAGRVCWPIRWESGLPPQRDESTGAVVVDQVAVYRLDSVPG